MRSNKVEYSTAIDVYCMTHAVKVATFTLRGGKKHRAMNVDGLTFLWDSGATESMIKRKTLNNMNEICVLIK